MRSNLGAKLIFPTKLCHQEYSSSSNNNKVIKLVDSCTRWTGSGPRTRAWSSGEIRQSRPELGGASGAGKRWPSSEVPATEERNGYFPEYNVFVPS